MEQFSHDLTLALEETANGRGRRWGIRRRTRSTGNLRKIFIKVFKGLFNHVKILACAPLPTEDSSSSQADHTPLSTNNNNANLNAEMCAGGGSNSIQSDSDDFMRSFALKLRHTPMSGNFESDSLNENFSPTR